LFPKTMYFSLRELRPSK